MGQFKLLTPIVVLVGLALMPVAARATTAQAPAGTTLKEGNAVSWQSTNSTFEAEGEGAAGNVTCSNEEMAGQVTSNGGESITMSITGIKATGCVGPMGTTPHYSTNATAAKPWTLRIQQPDASGQITAHFLPFPGSALQDSFQFQLFGISVATCDMSAPTIQAMGQTGSDVFHIEGKSQFVRQSGSFICGLFGTFKGQGSLKSASNTLRVDMT